MVLDNGRLKLPNGEIYIMNSAQISKPPGTPLRLILTPKSCSTFMTAMATQWSSEFEECLLAIHTEREGGFPCEDGRD